MKLGKLADIRTGLVLARKKAHKHEVNITAYKMLTLKSFEVDGVVNTTALDDFRTSQHINSDFITQRGDVIIRLSEPNTAIYIDETLTGLIIPSLFAIIRMNSERINPQFLTWLLNSQNVKREMHKSLIGSAIQVINTGFLQQLQIKIILIERQQKIVDINSLYLKEKMLITQWIKEKETFYKLAMNGIYREGI